MTDNAAKNLAGQRALITGANTGIGASIAKALAASGADVAVNYVTNLEAAESVVAACTSLGSESFAVSADVTDPTAVDQMFETIRSRFGRLDILVNNAGVDGADAVIWEADRVAWSQVVQVNLHGAFYCMRQALAEMTRRRSGVIVNITSVHEVMPWKGFSAYAAAKAALSMLTKTAALEAAPFGVRVLAVAPGTVQTAMNEKIWTKPKLRDQLLAKIPAQRLAQPEEIGTVVAWLVSDGARYQTGSTVYVDGGMLLYP